MTKINCLSYATSHRKDEKFMNKENYMNELSRLLDEIRRFTKLNGSWTKETITGNDMNILKDIAVSTQEIIEIIGTASAPENETDIKKILSSVGQFVKAIEASDPEKLTESSQMLEAIKTEYEQEKIKAGKLQEVFKTDLQEMELREKKRDALQAIVNMDLEAYGKVSTMTLEVLEVQHYKLSGQNQVQEQENPPKELVTEQTEQTVDEPGNQTEQSYKAFVYMKNDSDKKQKPKVIYGNSPEDIITTLQGWNMGRTDAMKFHTCYISRLDVQKNEYVNYAKYDVTTGIDITPIYLNIPHMDRNGFLKTVDQLKKDGAKYNPVEKKFYVTRQNDLNKFSKYLPIMAVQPEISTDQIQDNYSYEEESIQENPQPDTNKSQEETAEAETIEYNGQRYKPLQYNVLEIALKQNFTNEQMALLERPELSSDRLNEIRFAIKDGLSAAQLIKAKERENSPLTPNLIQTGIQKSNGGKDSVLSKISQNKAKLEASQNDADGKTRERREELDR